MNLKKFVFSSLGIAAFAAGTQAQAALIGLDPAPNVALFNSNASWIQYAYSAQSGIGTFTAEVDSDEISYDAPGAPNTPITYLPATFTFSATINASVLNSPVLTNGNFSIVKNATVNPNVAAETLLSGNLKTGNFGDTWGAANSAPTIFEFTFTPNQSGTFWQDFASGGNPGLGGIIFGLQSTNSFTNWQTPFTASSPAGSSATIFSINPSFVPEPSSALVGLLLTAGVLSNRRRRFGPRAASPSSPA